MKEDQETELIAANIFVRNLGKFCIHVSVEQTIWGFIKIMDISIFGVFPWIMDILFWIA